MRMVAWTTFSAVGHTASQQVQSKRCQAPLQADFVCSKFDTKMMQLHGSGCPSVKGTWNLGTGGSDHDALSALIEVRARVGYFAMGC